MNTFIKKNYVFFLVSFLLLFPLNVEASNKDANSTYADIGGCKLNYRHCWMEQNNSLAPGIQGVRITAYDSNGIRVSDSVDFTNSTATMINNINNRKYYMAKNRNNKSRIDYINSSGDIVAEPNLPNIKYANFSSFIQTKISKENLIKFEDEGYIKEMINFCKNSYESKCNSSSGKYFFVVEPLTIIFSRKKDYDYYGTYYELVQMIGSSDPFTKSGNGVNFFLPGNLAISLYIQSNQTEFKNFYNKVGLKIVSNSDVTEIVSLVNNQPSGATLTLSNKTSLKSNRSVGYGVGVIKFGDEPVTPSDSNFGNCKLVTNRVEPCNDRIEYEYKDCPTSGFSTTTYNVKGTKHKICEIQCDEKYYVATWGLRDTFSPVSGEKILAGTYFSISSPTVYHKKTCDYVSLSQNEIKSLAQTNHTTKVLRSNTYTISGTEYTRTWWETVIDWDAVNADVTDLTTKCSNLLSNYNDMKKEENEYAKNDKVGDLSLKMFSKDDYKLTAKKVLTELNINGTKFGYKNTFNYNLSGIRNQYIGMESGFGADTDQINLSSYYNFKQPMVTTPITLKSGIYNYNINYINIFSQSFKTQMSKLGVSINNSIKNVSCPYEIRGRNINNISDIINDPDSTFTVPSIKMVYRPIDLDIPFPGNKYTGIQRTPGSNWSEQSIKDYISENRNAQGQEVYQKEPLYVIDLDSSKIQQIRQYNKKHSYDDFSLACTKGTGRECVSNFLRGNLADFKVNLFRSGTCSGLNVKYDIPIPDDSGIPNLNFYFCADKWGD